VLRRFAPKTPHGGSPVRSVPAMRRAACALVLLAVAGCGSSTGDYGSGGTDPNASPVETTTDAPVDPASQLRDSDMSDGFVVVGSVAYQDAFATLQTRCNNPPDKLVLYVGNTLNVLQSKGVNDETRFTLLRHLAASVPAGVGPMDCLEIAGAYTTLRAP